jgi:DNA repair exonuclease SbcCD nuclease subunit
MLTVLNDIHIGVQRSAGTTPATQWELRKHILRKFKDLLPETGDCLLNGDMFDTSNVPIHDVLITFEILADWLKEHPASTLYNSAGNHDASKTSTVLSSFQFLGKLLKRQFPGQYVHIEEPMMTPFGYVIPHMRNQDVFNLALAEVPACDYVFVHANYNNGFAAESDQSLNVSAEQAEAMPCKHIIFGHEHHGRNAGKVIVPGNQIASSVADWLSPGDKKYIVIDDTHELRTAARRSDEFLEVSWKELGSVSGEPKFIRVSGSATSDEMGSAISALNKFRSLSSALVISNAIETVSDESAAEIFSANLESVAAFDIVAALRRALTTEEFSTIEPYVAQA